VQVSLALETSKEAEAKINRPKVKFGQNVAMEVATVTATNSATKIKRIMWQVSWFVS
jgi:phage antirepressor YoqD-like protein